jgi:hypothetical protein
MSSRHDHGNGRNPRISLRGVKGIGSVAAIVNRVAFSRYLP